MLEIDLFENIDDGNILELLQCFGIKTRVYKKNTKIIKTGDLIDYIAVIISGSVEIRKKDFSGNFAVIKRLKTNDIFAQSIVCLSLKKSPIEAISTENETEILFLPFEKIAAPCNKLCKCHLQLIKNVMKMISKQNNILHEQIDIIGQRTIRDKIFALLNNYKKEEGMFTIPFSRAETAKFLCVDRSALSRELCKMRDEGILKFHKNSFEFTK